VRRDLEKEWLQHRYYVKEEDIDMSIKDWKDDWILLLLNQEMPTGKEADAGKDQTPVKDKDAAKNPKPI